MTYKYNDCAVCIHRDVCCKTEEYKSVVSDVVNGPSRGASIEIDILCVHYKKTTGTARCMEKDTKKDEVDPKPESDALNGWDSLFNGTFGTMFRTGSK